MTTTEHPSPAAGPTVAPASPATRVSVLVPSRHGRVERVRRSLEQQTYTDWTLRVVSGVSPAARARNQAVAVSDGELLLFIDDDAYLGHERVLESLVAVLGSDPTIGVVGPSKILSPEASWLQRRISEQVPRWVHPVSEVDEESNPPLHRYGFSAITTTCCLMPRAVFEQVGGFDESLPTGEDTEFFYRIRRAGYRFVVPGKTWVCHDPPARLIDLVRKHFEYGRGHALEARKAPERGMAVVPLDRWYGRLTVLLAPVFLVATLFVGLDLDPKPRLRLRFAPLRALSTGASLAGYVWGWHRADR